MEDVGEPNNQKHHLVEEEDEVHQLHVLLVDVVIPDRSNRDQVVAKTQKEVKDEQKIEALVL